MQATLPVAALLSALAFAGIAAAEDDVAEGETLYIAHCRMCHGFNVEADAQAMTFGTADALEGIRAIQEKRAPKFEGK